MKKNEYFEEIEKIYKEMSTHFKERLNEFKNIWEKKYLRVKREIL